MENKEVFLIILVLAVMFALLSIVSDVTITGASVKEISTLSLNFSLITIVLVLILLISVIVELWKFNKK